MPDCGAGNSGKRCDGAAAGAGEVVGGERLLMKLSSINRKNDYLFNDNMV